MAGLILNSLMPYRMHGNSLISDKRRRGWSFNPVSLRT